jgi:hypothetical protein
LNISEVSANRFQQEQTSLNNERLEAKRIKNDLENLPLRIAQELANDNDEVADELKAQMAQLTKRLEAINAHAANPWRKPTPGHENAVVSAETASIAAFIAFQAADNEWSKAIREERPVAGAAAKVERDHWLREIPRTAWRLRQAVLACGLDETSGLCSPERAFVKGRGFDKDKFYADAGNWREGLEGLPGEEAPARKGVISRVFRAK